MIIQKDFFAKEYKRLTIGIDMDDVCNNFMGALLDVYNKEYNDNIQLDDITSWDFQHLLKPECKNVFKEFCDTAFMINLECDYIQGKLAA